MDETLYQQWWPLHLRVARGDKLDAEQQNHYEVGLRQMEQDESAPSLATLREARAALESLRADNFKLNSRGKQLDAEIATLEAALDAETRRLLGLGD